MTKQKQFFEITSISRDDLLMQLKDSGNSTPEMVEKIKALSDTDMEGIARGMADVYLESGLFWEFIDQWLENEQEAA